MAELSSGMSQERSEEASDRAKALAGLFSELKRVLCSVSPVCEPPGEAYLRTTTVKSARGEYESTLVEVGLTALLYFAQGVRSLPLLDGEGELLSTVAGEVLGLRKFADLWVKGRAAEFGGPTGTGGQIADHGVNGADSSSSVGVVPAKKLTHGEQYLVLRALEELARSRRDECSRLLGVMSYPGQDLAARRLMRGVDDVEALAARVASSRVVLIASPDGEVA